MEVVEHLPAYAKRSIQVGMGHQGGRARSASESQQEDLLDDDSDSSVDVDALQREIASLTVRPWQSVGMGR